MKLFFNIIIIFLITTKSFSFSSISHLKIYDSIKNYKNDTGKVYNQTDGPFPTRSMHYIKDADDQNNYGMVAITDLNWETGDDKILAVRLFKNRVIEDQNLNFGIKTSEGCNQESFIALNEITKNENLDHKTFENIIYILKENKNYKSPTNLLTGFNFNDAYQFQYQIPIKEVVNNEEVETSIDGILQIRCRYSYKAIGEKLKNTQFKKPLLLSRFEISYGTKEYFDRYNDFIEIQPEKNSSPFIQRLANETYLNLKNLERKDYTGLKFELVERSRLIKNSGERLRNNSGFIMCYYKGINYLNGKKASFKGTDLKEVSDLSIMQVDTRDCLDPYMHNDHFYNATYLN